MNVPHVANDLERKQYFPKLRELMVAALQDDELLGQFQRDWEAKIPLRARTRLPLAPIEQRAPIGMETEVRLATARRLVFNQPTESGKVPFTAGEIRGECSFDLVPALEKLSGTSNHSVRELCAHVPSQESARMLMILLTALAMKGAVWTERPANT